MSLLFNFVLVCVIFVVLFSELLLLLAVGRFGLYGSAPVGRLHYAGQRGFEACWVSACSCYLLPSNRDESCHKIKTSSVFLPRELRQNRDTCVCLFWFLSKNENNNGFDTIG